MNEIDFIHNNSKIDSVEIQNYINKNYSIKKKRVITVEENIADFNFIENILNFCGHDYHKSCTDEPLDFGIIFAQFLRWKYDFGGLYTLAYDEFIDPIIVYKNSSTIKNKYQFTSLISKENINIHTLALISKFLIIRANEVEDRAIDSAKFYKPLFSKYNMLSLHVPLRKVMLIEYHYKNSNVPLDIIDYIKRILINIYFNLIINIAKPDNKPSIKYMLAKSIFSGITRIRYIKKFILNNWKINITTDEDAKKAIKELISAPEGEPRLIVVKKFSYSASEELIKCLPESERYGRC